MMIFVIAAALAAHVGGGDGQLVLAQRGEPACCTVSVATNADDTVRFAARELCSHVKLMTGVELKTVEGLPSEKAVVLGCDPALPQEDAFRLKADGGNLYITGGGSRGVLYGVYGVLERFGDCDWFAPWCNRIPKRQTFAVPGNLDFSDAPAFEQREASWRHCIIGDRFAKRQGNAVFAARRRFNGQWRKMPLYGGTAVPFAKGLGICHTFEKLVPPKEHFAKHPEWFSEINGRRIGERSQLCWSNPELTVFVAEEIKKRLRAEPNAKMVGLSQNDWRNYCQCAECSACTKAEGSPAGPNLKFVNAVAEMVEKEFPGVMIETLAYMFTRKPPKTVRPRHNVAVCLCSFECSFSMPFAESGHSHTVAFCEDLRSCGKICRNLFIYNYGTNFRNYLFPFPNIYAIAGNYRLFRECGARWLYDQCDSNGHHGEFAELKCYLQSKLMWNPDQDVEALIDRFMKGYYGSAAPIVRKYFNELYASFGIRNEHNPDPDAEPSSTGIYGENLPQLSDAKLDEWMALWREAEAAVKGKAKFEYNVRMGSLPVSYVKLKRLYERGYKTVWIATNAAVHIAAMEAIKPVAAELVARFDEAKASRRTIALSEDYRIRHKLMMSHFRDIATWKAPANGDGSAVLSTNDMVYVNIDRLWHKPIREFAVDEGAKYRVRVRLRPKKQDPSRLGVAQDAYGFAAGLHVRWLPRAKGRRRLEIPREKMKDDWEWYDIGVYEFSDLQKIPRPTMDGLCLFVQGDVEVDRLEISEKFQ